MIYFIPCPKSPHGTDVDPTGEYIVASGKLAATIPVFSFTKLQQAIAAKSFDGNYDGFPVLKYESVLHGEVQSRGWDPYIRSLMPMAMPIPPCLFLQRL